MLFGMSSLLPFVIVVMEFLYYISEKKKYNAYKIIKFLSVSILCYFYIVT